MSEHDPAAGKAARDAWISRRAVFRALGALILIAGGIASVQGLEAAMNATFNKPPAPLRQQLTSFPVQLGIPARYSKSGEDEVMLPEMVETLGTDDYLLRRYVENTPRPSDPHSLVTLNLNYYATGSSTPHVPEICWAANGLEEVSNSRQFFDVPEVKHADGSVSTLRMRLISFMPPKGFPSSSEAGEPLYMNVAYVFQVNGEYVASPQEVMSHFWSASNKFAYHCKIEVSPLDAERANGSLLCCTQAQAREIISKFIREALPAVEDCLPDPVILKQGLPAERAGGGK